MTLDEVERNYDVILCDLWGCIHDGVNLDPGAAERVARWHSDGRKIIFITNAPRTADAVAAGAEIDENERISSEFRRELLAACTRDALGDAMERLA